MKSPYALFFQFTFLNFFRNCYALAKIINENSCMSILSYRVDGTHSRLFILTTRYNSHCTHNKHTASNTNSTHNTTTPSSSTAPRPSGRITSSVSKQQEPVKKNKRIYLLKLESSHAPLLSHKLLS